LCCIEPGDPADRRFGGDRCGGCYFLDEGCGKAVEKGEHAFFGA